MASVIRNALEKGAILAVVIIFLVVIGFTAIISLLIGRALGTIGSITNLILFNALVGLAIGSTAAKPATDSWGKSLLAGAVAGIVSGGIIALFSFGIGNMSASGIDVRAYLSALSPGIIQQWLLNRSPVDGAMSHLLVLLGASIVGALLGTWSRRSRAFARLWSGATGLTNLPVVRNLRRSTYTKYVIGVLAAVLLILLPNQWGSYWNYIMGTVGIYILLGLGMNIIVGLSGQLVLGYVAFFGIGAYAFALLTAPVPHQIELNFWVAVLAAILIAALAGVLIGFPILRLRGDYLAIVTLGFGEIIRILLRSDLMSPLTAGPRGVRDIAGPSLLGQSIASDSNFMYLIIIAVVVIIFISARLQNSRIGRAWVSIREDETVAQASGVDTFKYKLLALALGAAFAGLGGALFASRNQFTGPEDHVLMVSINVLCIVIVGGMGSIPGVILGAFALKGLPEILRDLENYRLLVFGALLVMMMIMRPEGLWPSHRPKLERKETAEPVPIQEEKALELEVNQ